MDCPVYSRAKSSPLISAESLEVVQTVDAVGHGRVASVGGVPLEELTQLTSASAVVKRAGGGGRGLSRTIQVSFLIRFVSSWERTRRDNKSKRNNIERGNKHSIIRSLQMCVSTEVSFSQRRLSVLLYKQNTTKRDKKGNNKKTKPRQ